MQVGRCFGMSAPMHCKPPLIVALAYHFARRDVCFSTICLVDLATCVSSHLLFATANLEFVSRQHRVWFSRSEKRQTSFLLLHYLSSRLCFLQLLCDSKWLCPFLRWGWVLDQHFCWSPLKSTRATFSTLLALCDVNDSCSCLFVKCGDASFHPKGWQELMQVTRGNACNAGDAYHSLCQQCW